MTRPFLLTSWVWLAILTSALPAQNIKPDQVLIICNYQNPDSARLAHLYSRQRNIPDRNILMLDIPDRDEIPRPQYNQWVAYPIEQFIRMQKLEQKIKILVTIYGIPLKVGPAQSTPVQRDLARHVERKYRAAFSELETTFRELEKLAGIPTTRPTTLPGRDKIEQFLQNFLQLTNNIQNLYQRIIPKITAMKDLSEREQSARIFMNLRLALEGQTAIAMLMQRNAVSKDPTFIKRITNLEGEFYGLLGALPEKRDLDKTYQLAGDLGGALLKLRTMHEDYGRLMQTDSLAAVDSELTLVLWNEYVLAGRLPNGLNPRFAQISMIAGKGPILMVSRLDGPNPRTVERIIRDSIETEKRGLTGTFYIDARGIKNQDGFFQYDEDLRTLAKQMKNVRKMPVVLDDKPELFPPGSCPNTALYCGWYSLRNYIPAFTFQPGSVGYHIASFEAVSLRNSQSNLWVKRMLQNGICATLGPVEEPFLDAFPLPSEFFGLLLTGKYTLAETFFRTIRYNSWRMILIGDPLYNPFAKTPLLKEADLQLKPLNLLLLQ